MKKILLFVFLMVSLSVLFVMAADNEWTGVISEAGCGVKHAEGGPEAEKCVAACVAKGSAPVFVTDGKVIKISNTDKVMEHLGHKVVVTGKLEGETLTIDTIKMPEAASK